MKKILIKSPQDLTYFAHKKSVLGKKWVQKEVDERLSLALSQRFELPEIVGRLLSLRGLNTLTAEDFLKPTLRRLMPDPSHLLDLDQAINRVIKAIENKEKIVVYGDYDVDGATSSALFVRYMRDIDFSIDVYIPDRIEEGYGPNKNALQTLKQQDASLIIFVDCGTTSFEPLAFAKQLGLDCIIIDHHAAQVSLPEVLAVINPNRVDEISPLKNLCAAGLSFVF
ncbi:MAG: DHH family phosphoesterase, partial [Proteobacteria bacterium]|nr:DHH family phosphoesterase [Pseudomonadota bacterium]